MTREESLEIVEMVISGWPQAKQMDKTDMDMYARSIQDLDAELATHAVLQAVKDSKYQPTVKELRDRVWMEKRKLAPQVDPLPESAGSPIPLWVKRWICARMLFKAFDKERDMRRFKEQGDHGDLTQEVMPEGAWVDEANTLSDEEAVRRWRIATNQ